MKFSRIDEKISQVMPSTANVDLVSSDQGIVSQDVSNLLFQLPPLVAVHSEYTPTRAPMCRIQATWAYPWKGQLQRVHLRVTFPYQRWSLGIWGVHLSFLRNKD